MSLGASFEYALMMRTERMRNEDHRANQPESDNRANQPESDHRANQPESELDDNIDIESREGLARMHRRLEERRSYLQRTRSRWSSVCIYRVPRGLTGGVSADTIAPEIVSIGPYHRGRERVLKFDNYKWSFLDYVLSFTRKKGIDLDRIMTSMADVETSARRCYSEPISISSVDFVQMMILDSCLILGYMLRQLVQGDGPITPSIPIVIRDLLKLENQIPFFILEMVYDLMKTINGDSLELLALKFFNLALPRRDQEILKRLSVTAKPKHLLDLVHSSYLPSTVNQPTTSHIHTTICRSVNPMREAATKIWNQDQTSKSKQLPRNKF